MSTKEAPTVSRAAEPDKYLGCLDAYRQEHAIAKDYLAAEVGLAKGSFNWQPMSAEDEAEVSAISVYNQQSRNSCVAEAFCKAASWYFYKRYGKWYDFSRAYFYRQRRNKGQAGMFTDDAGKIATEIGFLADMFLQSDNLKNDAAVDTAVVPDFADEFAKPTVFDKYFWLPVTMDAIAAKAAEGVAVPITIFADYTEWKREVPLGSSKKPYWELPINHKVTVLKPTVYKGKPALYIHDSWGTGQGKNGSRIITEDFFNYNGGRVFNPVYLLNAADKYGEAQVPINPNKPKHTFSIDVEWRPEGQWNKNNVDEVVWLQKCLDYLGLWDKRYAYTGNYHNVTAKAVLAFQKQQKLQPDAQLESNGGKYCHRLTREALNRLFA